MSNFPAFTSPSLVPSDQSSKSDQVSVGSLNNSQSAPPPELISPSFTPPSTPGTGTPAAERDAIAIPVDTSAPLPKPKLLASLPEVNCVVRARIPTTTGQQMFLHLYHNDIDKKEHLAIVFGSHIRSRSLDAPRPGETDMDRMIRGAYTGTLYPGRANSGFAPTTSTASPLEKNLHKHIPSPTDTGDKAHGIATVSTNASSDHAKGNVGPMKSIGTIKKSTAPQAPLVRIHSECYTGETVWSARCDCGEQLDEAARLMSLPSAQESGGVIVYLRQEGRGIGLSEKLKAYNLQDLGNDTVEANLLLRHPADARSYGLATAILVDLGLGSTEKGVIDEPDTARETQPDANSEKNGAKGIRLLTNNPDKVRAIEGPNREVVVRERVPMIPIAWRPDGGARGIRSPEVSGYLRTKVSGKILSLLNCCNNFCLD